MARAPVSKSKNKKRGRHATVARSAPSHDPEYDYPAPSRRVAGASSNRKAMDATRLRLTCLLVAFSVGFGGIGMRVIQIGFAGSMLHWHEAQASTDMTHKASEPFFDERPEQPKMMDALLGDESAVPQEEMQATVDATNAAARPKRGDITDRNGKVVATSVITQSLYADATILRQFNVADAVKKIHAIFPDISEPLLTQRIQKGKKFVYIKRHLTPQEQAAVMALGSPGLLLQPDARRVYPQGSLLAHVLGYVDIDNKGIAGIEKKLEARLTDPAQNQEPLQLSIDVRVQHILRHEMARAIEEFQAIGAAGIVMDMENGQLIGMESLPDFDPNNIGNGTGKVSDDAKFNRASLGVYEMGSTFKTFSLAMALQYGTANMEKLYDATHAIQIGKFTIRDAHPENRWLTPPEVYAYSSNIGTVRIIQEVGVARQKAFLKQLGLMQPVEIEIPERGYPLVPKDWKEINMMTIAYGHGMSVTPLHLVRAVAAVAGDGVLKPITLLKDAPEVHHAPAQRFVSEKVSHQMRDLMRLVVEYGTAKKANAPGYEVGGKTGTAEKVQGGRYAHNDKMASFIGIFPASHPRYVVLVMMDTPRGNKSTYGFATGGWVSAPVVGRVVSRIGPLLGMKPNMTAMTSVNVEPWLEHARTRLTNAKD